MKRSIAIFAYVVFMVACSKDEEVSKHHLLTNGNTKDWNVIAETPESPKESCRPTAAHAIDNTLSFSSDGTFKYDNGTLTEGEDCSDLINLTGEWKFTDNESNLLITSSYETGNPSHTFDGDTLVFGSIETLTASALVIGQDGKTATYSPK
jgi:hypothetical protein